MFAKFYLKKLPVFQIYKQYYTESFNPRHLNLLLLNRLGTLQKCLPRQIQRLTQLDQFIPLRCFCQTTVADMDKKLNPTGTEKKKLTKNVPIEKIFLILESDDISQVTLLEAEKMAKKKGLQLVKVDDTKGRIKTDKKVYRLVSNAQYFGDDWRSRVKNKDSGASVKDKHKEDKSLVIKSKITQHDLMSKIKNIIKLVEKGYNVRIFIEEVSNPGSNLDASEAVYNIMEENLKESARIVQKRSKGSEIRFQVIPPKVEDNSKKDKVVEHDET